MGAQFDVVGSQFDQKPSNQRNEEIIYLVVSTHLKNISQNGNLLQIGVQIKFVWNILKPPPSYVTGIGTFGVQGYIKHIHHCHRSLPKPPPEEPRHKKGADQYRPCSIEAVQLSRGRRENFQWLNGKATIFWANWGNPNGISIWANLGDVFRYIYIILYIYIWGLSLKVTPCITIVGAHLVPSEQALMFNWEYIDSIRVHFPASYATGMNIFRMRTETCFQDVSLQAQFFFFRNPFQKWSNM